MEDFLKCLSPAEYRLIPYILTGDSSVEIAGKVFLSPRTIETHVCNILNKLHISTRQKLIHIIYSFMLAERESKLNAICLLATNKLSPENELN